MVWKAKKGGERDGGGADRRVKSKRWSGSWLGSLWWWEPTLSGGSGGGGSGSNERGVIKLN